MVLHEPRVDPEIRSMLQKHLDYFDTDHDDIFSPWDTYVGLRDPIWLAASLALIFHLAFSYPTRPKFNRSGAKLDPLTFIVTLPARILSRLPDPFLRIDLENIADGIHGSDTQTYNTYGEFEQRKFDDIFEKYSSAPNKDGITVADTFRMWRSQQRLLDFVGPIFNALEWFALWYTLWPKSGVITKDDLRGCLDGSLWYILAEQRSVNRSGRGA
ncbi:Caleosin-domain-containing protein [Clavulina sp. PMI_390]|nr:Caleosin-domain-containing protein [Clavulina sp. PMI_390]